MRTAKKCRAVVVTKDGHRHLTRWFKCPDVADPDELPPMMKAIRAAERYAERKKLDVKQINGISLTRAGAA